MYVLSLLVKAVPDMTCNVLNLAQSIDPGEMQTDAE